MKLIPQVYHDYSGQGRFRNSFRLCWTALWAGILLMLLSLVVGGKEAMGVMTVGIPTLFGLAAAWSGITNWAEIRGVGAGFQPPSPPAPPDQSKQSVNVVVKPPEDPKLD